MTQYFYDTNGNTIEKSTGTDIVTYAYNDLNQMISATTADNLVEFEYDADGARVARTVDGETVEYLLDKNRRYHQVLEERTDTGDLIAEYVYGNQRISMARDGEDRFYHYDGHGSTSGLSDSTGLITDDYSYDAFGNLLASTGIGINPFLYTGEAWDEETGLEYLRARYYAPGVGRFVNMDTHPGSDMMPLTLNKYLYGNGNPVMGVDPSGNFTMIELGAAIGIASILATTALVSYSMYSRKVRDGWSRRGKKLFLVTDSEMVGRLDSLESLASLKGYTVHNEFLLENPSKNDFLSVLRNAGRGDMVLFAGHGKTGQIAVDGKSVGITTSEIVSQVGDGTPPGFVALAGCNTGSLTGNDSMANALTSAGVGIAMDYVWSVGTYQSGAVGPVLNFTNSLLQGNSVSAAVQSTKYDMVNVSVNVDASKSIYELWQ